MLVYLSGALTTISLCILPVLPFVFARMRRPFVTSILLTLAGVALTFSLVASLVVVGGNWAVQANELGRVVALLMLAMFDLTLVLSGRGNTPDPVTGPPR